MKRSVLLSVLLVLAVACGDEPAGDQGATRLEDFFDQDPDTAMASAQERQREQQAHIAECMAAQGFEYVPHDAGVSYADPYGDLDPDEFREEFGFGISTRPDFGMPMEEMPEDPNMAIQEAMDEAEREAYHRALYGEQPDMTDADPDEPVAFEPGGCQQEAFEAVQGDQTEVMEELGDAFQELFERVEADPRIVAAKQEWSACMRGEGWDFSERWDPSQHVMEQMDELRGMSGGAMEAVEIPEDAGELAEGEQRAVEMDLPGQDIDEEALAELQELELELAALTHDCAQEHLEGVEETVRAELEGEFIEQHRDALERMRDSM